VISTKTFHSIWLLPEEHQAEQLREIISQLCIETRCPNFEPHATLVGDLEMSPKQSASVCKEVFSGSGSIVGKAAGIERTPSFFRSLCVNLTFDDNILNKQKLLSHRFRSGPSSDFRPHVSLAYGLSESQKLDAKCLAKIVELARKNINFDRIAVVNSAQLIPIEDWSILAIIDL
jgi:2'-5' RNA ligase